MIEQLEVRRLLAGQGLDLAFGEGGVAAGLGPNGTALVVKETLGGKFLAGGYGDESEPVVARFNKDGSLDQSFDGDGKLDLPQEVYGNVTSAAFGPDGKLVLVYHESLELSLKLFRFNADGTVDSSFGMGGSITHRVKAEHSFFDEQISIQPDGKIFIGYTADWAQGNEKTYLARLNSDGSVDNGFRGGFANGAALPITIHTINTVATGPGGKVYIVGESGWVAEILAVNGDGSVDSSFGGGDGVAEVPTTSEESQPFDNALTVAPDGKLLVLFKARSGERKVPVLARLRTSGLLDKTFGGGDGLVAVPISAGYKRPMSVVVGTDGTITGMDYSDTSSLISLFRVTSAGVLDASFGTNGTLVPGERTVEPSSIALDATGNILVAGSLVRFLSSQQFAIARYVADAPKVAITSSGNIFVLGTSDADVVTVERAGDQIIVNRNGASTSFAAASVKKLTVYAGSGGDVITVAIDVKCDIGGGTGNDTIVLAGGDVLIEAGTGNDRITCGKGNHTIFLGTGNNRVVTGRGKDTIVGENGNDTIITGAQSDYIVSRGGNDSITCGSGWDSIYTGEGNDTVHAGAGNDKVQDTLDPNENSDGDLPGLAHGHKRYYGEEGNDSIIGSLDADTLMGNGGADSIQGGGGADSISGSGGKDELWANRFYPDTPYYDNIDIARNTIHGGEGDDHLWGASGNDRLYGDSGNDRLYGMDGNDVLLGGDGNDRFEGGAGKDQLFGDLGRDTALADKNDVLRGVEVRR